MNGQSYMELLSGLAVASTCLLLATAWKELRLYWKIRKEITSRPPKPEEVQALQLLVGHPMRLYFTLFYSVCNCTFAAYFLNATQGQ